MGLEKVEVETSAEESEEDLTISHLIMTVISNYDRFIVSTACLVLTVACILIGKCMSKATAHQIYPFTGNTLTCTGSKLCKYL